MPKFLRFFGNTASEAAAFGMGAATAPAIRPILQELTNLTWGAHPIRPPDAGTLANGVAQGQVDPGDAAVWAAEQGIGPTQFKALVDIANTGPGIPAAFDLWRRGVITETAFRRAAKRQGIEPEWVDDLVKVKTLLLAPAEIANAVQQGHLPNPGIIPDVSAEVPAIGGQVTPHAPDGHPPQDVPLTTIDLDPITEAAGSGVDEPRLKVKTNLAGLPPGAAELLTMWNRGIITEEAVDAGIREGHTKTKWTGPVKRLKWAVLGAAEYASAHLRGWITEAEMYAGGRLTGHTKEQMDLLYLNRGRPLAPVQAYTAAARKSPGPVGPGYDRGPHPFDEQDFLRALRQSDVRTEYGPTLWANRFAYPSLFQLNRLVQAGAITAEVAAEWAVKDRYAPEVIAALTAYWNTGTAAVADKNVTKAQVQLWSATHSSYIAAESADTDVTNRFDLLGIPAAAQTAILELWDAERALIRKQLSPKEIRKAFTAKLLNPATGVPWTERDVSDALLARGYSDDDVRTFLLEA